MLSCNEIANTEDRQEKNEIFVETFTGTAAGFITGFVVTTLLVSNPVGWGVAIILGVGTSAVAYGTGKAFRTAYSISEVEIDFVSGLGVDKVCK